MLGDIGIFWQGVNMLVTLHTHELVEPGGVRPEGWYFSCKDCGNSGKHRADCSDAIQDAMRHAEGHP